MVDTERTRAELLTLLADGQPEGSIAPQDMRDLVVTTAHDSVSIIRQESDFPSPVEAPDGVMRIPLEITTSYIFDVGELEISTPFWMPERLLGLERVRMQSFTNTTVIYTGNDTLFWGRNAGALESDKVDRVAQTPGTQCFDMVAGFGLVSLTIFNTAFLDWDMGFIDGFALFGRRFGMVRPVKPFRLHNLTRCFVDNLRFVAPPDPPAEPASHFVMTGGDGLANPKFENTLTQPMQPGQSYFALDAGSDYQQIGFENVPLIGSDGSFFELDLTGSISAFADLSVLIDESATAYELYSEDGSNFTKVTSSVAHSVYVGLTVDHIGTTNYNGQHTVVRVLGNDQYVMDVLHAGDESSGSYTGIGTRVTTLAAHKLTEHRTTEISGSGDANYDVSGLEVLNVVTPGFDITVPFSTSPATGNYMTTSLDEKHVSVLAVNNGALPNSMTLSSVRSSRLFILGSSLTGAGSDFTPIEDGSPQTGDFIIDAEERITIDDQTGLATYNGPTDINVEVKYSLDVGGDGATQDLEFAVAKNGVVEPSSILPVTAPDTPSLASVSYIGTILLLAPGNTVGLVMRNTDTGTDKDTDISNIRLIITPAG